MWKCRVLKERMFFHTLHFHISTLFPIPYSLYGGYMGFVKVAEAAEVLPGTGRVVRAGGRELALFHIEGAFYCIDNDCPHREGPLGEGELEGDTVICPWHAWEISVKTGEVLY